MVDKIYPHFTYTNGNRSILDRVDILPVKADSLLVTSGASLGRSYLRKALYRVYSWAEIEPI